VGLPLKIAARMPLPNRNDPQVRRDWDYWENVVEPLLGGGVELIGEVGGPEKSEFLGKAAALLFPVDWPEPFGLVMVEALACGTPVLALRNGSVPEVIEEGRTGFIRNNEEELADALERLESLDRAECRRVAECRFSTSAMATAYERVYGQLIVEAAGRRMIDLGAASTERETAGLASV
jgi:glycosyltransferase involved in cell wall biosynthesis